MNNFAPVLIPTLNRHVHFKKCIESLSKCIGADKTDLFIALDYPLNETHWEGYKIIKEYLPTITGFKSITIFERNHNFGAAKNLGAAAKIINENHDRKIISEDDNVFGPSFLKFVNKGLDVYEEREDIFSVTGYNSPIIMPDWYMPDAYLRQNYCGWGVGTWLKKSLEVKTSMKALSEIFERNISNIKNDYPQLIYGIKSMIKSGLLLGDLTVFLHMYDRGMYSVYPTKTRVKNIGTDGSGLHAPAVNKKYLYQKLDINVEGYDLPEDLEYNEELNKIIVKSYKRPAYEKVINLLREPMRRMGFNMNRVELQNYLKQSFLKEKHV